MRSRRGDRFIPRWSCSHNRATSHDALGPDRHIRHGTVAASQSIERHA